MEEQTGQKQGAVSPFGYEEQIPIIIDEELLSKENLFLHQEGQIKRWSSKRLT